MITLKKIARWAMLGLGLLIAAILITALTLRFVIFPNIDQYKDGIAAHLSSLIGQKVTIGDIVTGWDSFSPHIALHNLDIFDAEKRVALHLNNVEASLSWLSVPMLQPKLNSLIVHQPALTIRREMDGSIYLAGFALKGESKPELMNWLLRQREVNIKNARIIWQDDLRQAPALSLNQFNLTLHNPVLHSLINQHQLIMSAFPSVGSPQKMFANGRFIGRDVANIKTWHGDFFIDLKQTELSAYKPWLDYPIDIKNGVGSAKVWLTFANARIHSVKTQAAIKHLVVVTKNQTVPFIAEKFSGEVQWQDKNNTQTFTAKNITLNTNNGLNIRRGSGSYARAIKNNQAWSKAEIQVDTFNLDALKQMATQIDLPSDMQAQLDGFAPTGTLNALRLSWETINNKLDRYQINTNFSQLGIQAFQKVPGFSHLSGSIEASEARGSMLLNTKKALLDFKNILRWPIPADKLTGKIDWKIHNQKATINAKDIHISSPHIIGTFNASFDMQKAKGGYLDLTAKFNKGDAKYAPFYYPIILGEETLHWLDTSILAGRAEDINLTVKGHLADFPFVNNQQKPDATLGVFKASAKVSDAVLAYGSDWPVIRNLGLDLLFEGKSMLLTANTGDVLGIKLIKSRAQIAQLDADKPILQIVSKAEGQVSDGIRFINESPVKQVALGFTDHLKVAGQGTLFLNLNIPLKNVEATTYKGVYKLSDGEILTDASTGLPELSKINGSLTFNENGVSAKNVRAELLGGPVQFNFSTRADKTILISANGRVHDSGIKKMMSNVFTEKMFGYANWASEISIKSAIVNMNFHSNLVGMAINLPPPFNKIAQQELNLRVDKKQMDSSSDLIHVNYGQLLSAKLLRNNRAGQLTFEQGDIGINAAANNPSQSGLIVHGKLDVIDTDDWLTLYIQNSAQNSAQNSEQDSAQNSVAKTDLPVIKKADIAIDQLIVAERAINALKITAQPSATGFKMAVDSQEVSGDIEWQSADNGKITARLKRLIIPKSVIPQSTSSPIGSLKTKPKREFKKLAQSYPALDIVADQFEMGAKKLGLLNLNTFENGEDWVIQKLSLTNPDSTLSVQGNWHNWTRNPNTSLIVLLTSNNIGKTLLRFGEPDAVKGGNASISGNLNWAGSPHEFDVTRLNGNLTVEATKGQVLKVKPGVGRLLGLLTLQSLPRRLSLDFRDLFSEGFAFDKISATAKIDNGIVSSNDFLMAGPAAQALIKGETNLKTETQNLTIKVTPNVSDSLSLAALVGGPIVGAAAFVAQKILKDPFNKIASTEYRIIGTWDNPIEVKSDKNPAQDPSNTSPLTQ